MTAIKLDQFRGLNRMLSPHLIAPNQAQNAVNARLGSGVLTPYNGTAFESALAKVGTIQTLYRWADSYWFHWTADVDVAPGPVPGDTENRTYFTGDAEPKMTYAGIATSGGSAEYPTNSYTLGVPAPDTAPTITVTGTPDDATDLAEARVYAYCWVSAKGEPGPLSPASSVAEVKPGQTAELASMESVPTGNYNIATKRIYRVNSTASGDEYQLVDEIDTAETTYSDVVLTENLGEVVESADWYPPPDDMHSLIALPNGGMAGASKNELCLCEPYVPHAWPFAYRVSTEHPIVALAAVGSLIVVTTTGNPYLASATHPSALTLEKLELAYACVSKRSMVDMGYAAIYAGADGLVGVGQGAPQVVTEQFLSVSAWRALKPSSIHAYRLDDSYLGFYDTGTVQGGFIFDPAAGDFTFIDLHATGGWTDPQSGDLFLVVDNEVVRWDAGAALEVTWKSKLFIASRPMNPSVMQVDALAYPVHLRLWADGDLKYDGEVGDGRVKPLPSGYLADRFEVEVRSESTVRSVAFAESVEELKQL